MPASVSASPTVSAVVSTFFSLPPLSMVTVFAVLTVRFRPSRPIPALRLVDRSAPLVSSRRLCSAWSTVVAVVQNDFCLPVDLDRDLAAVLHGDLGAVADRGVEGGDDDVLGADRDALAGEHVADRPAHGGDLLGLAVDGQGDVVVQRRVGEGRAGHGEGRGPSSDDGDDLAHECSLTGAGAHRNGRWPKMRGPKELLMVTEA